MGLFSKNKKPVREKPVKPVKQKPDKPVKNKVDKPVKEKAGKPVKEKQPKPVNGRPVKGKSKKDTLNENLLQPDINEDIQPIVEGNYAPDGINLSEVGGDNQYGIDVENSHNENQLFEPQQPITGYGSYSGNDSSDLVKSTEVRVNGFKTSLLNYFTSVQSAVKKSRNEGISINVRWGDAVNTIVDIAVPSFRTDVKRIVDGKLHLVDTIVPTDVSPTSNNEVKVRVPASDLTFKNHTILIGVMDNGSPLVSQALFDTQSDKLVSRFPKAPKVVSIVVLIPEYTNITI